MWLFVVVTTMYPFRESTITTFCSLLWRRLTLETSAQNLFTEANLHASINSVDKNQIIFSYFLTDAVPQFLQKLTPFILYHIEQIRPNRLCRGKSCESQNLLDTIFGDDGSNSTIFFSSLRRRF